MVREIQWQENPPTKRPMGKDKNIMNFIIGIYLFVVFKFAPSTIDSRADKFWRDSLR
jgi:hypothetical protein